MDDIIFADYEPYGISTLEWSLMSATTAFLPCSFLIDCHSWEFVFKLLKQTIGLSR